MVVFDWFLIAVLISSMLIGAGRGLVFEVLSVLGWVAAFMAAQWFASDAAAQLPLNGVQESVRHAAGFIVVLVAAAFVCGFLAWLGKQTIEAIGLRPVDRVLGAAFGAVRAILLLLVLTVVVELTPLQQSMWWQESHGAPLLSTTLKGLKPALPQEFGRYLPS